MTQRELATQAGVDPSAISRLEQGDRVPLVLTLVHIAAALDTSVEDLLPLRE